MLVWPKNYQTYIEMLQKGLVYGVALTAEGMIALEVGASTANMRLGILIDPRKRTITHFCPTVAKGKPCWHLAAGVDALAFAAGKRLALPQRGPLADVEVVDKQVAAGTPVHHDATADFYSLKNVLYLRKGDFKVFALEEREGQTEEAARTPRPGFLVRLGRAFLAFTGAIQV
jgi:hypothetical protein